MDDSFLIKQNEEQINKLTTAIKNAESDYNLFENRYQHAKLTYDEYNQKVKLAKNELNSLREEKSKKIEVFNKLSKKLKEEKKTIQKIYKNEENQVVNQVIDFVINNTIKDISKKVMNSIQRAYNKMKQITDKSLSNYNENIYGEKEGNLKFLSENQTRHKKIIVIYNGSQLEFTNNKQLLLDILFESCNIFEIDPYTAEFISSVSSTVVNLLYSVDYFLNSKEYLYNNMKSKNNERDLNSNGDLSSKNEESDNKFKMSKAPYLTLSIKSNNKVNVIDNEFKIIDNNNENKTKINDKKGNEISKLDLKHEKEEDKNNDTDTFNDSKYSIIVSLEKVEDGIFEKIMAIIVYIFFFFITLIYFLSKFSIGYLYDNNKDIYLNYFFLDYSSNSHGNNQKNYYSALNLKTFEDSYNYLSLLMEKKVKTHSMDSNSKINILSSEFVDAVSIFDNKFLLIGDSEIYISMNKTMFNPLTKRKLYLEFLESLKNGFGKMILINELSLSEQKSYYSSTRFNKVINSDNLKPHFKKVLTYVNDKNEEVSDIVTYIIRINASNKYHSLKLLQIFKKFTIIRNNINQNSINLLDTDKNLFYDSFTFSFNLLSASDNSVTNNEFTFYKNNVDGFNVGYDKCLLIRLEDVEEVKNFKININFLFKLFVQITVVAFCSKDILFLFREIYEGFIKYKNISASYKKYENVIPNPYEKMKKEIRSDFIAVWFNIIPIFMYTLLIASVIADFVIIFESYNKIMKFSYNFNNRSDLISVNEANKNYFIESEIKGLSFYTNIKNDNGFLTFKDKCEKSDQFAILDNFAFVSVIIFFIFQFDRRLFSIIILTFDSSKKMIINFMMCFSLVIIGSGLSCHYIYGDYIWEFSSITFAIRSFIKLSFGDTTLIKKMYDVNENVSKLLLFISGFSLSIVFYYWIITCINFYYDKSVIKDKEIQNSTGINSTTSLIMESELLVKKIYRNLFLMITNLLKNVNFFNLIKMKKSNTLEKEFKDIDKDLDKEKYENKDNNKEKEN